jgi:hypothetical protein
MKYLNKPATYLVAFLIFPLLTLSGCANRSPRLSSQEYDQVLKIALRLQIDCGDDNISKIDDNRSDARTIALALALRCTKEYNEVTKTIASNMDNEAQSAMIRDRRNTQNSKIETFLPLVMTYRNSFK